MRFRLSDLLAHLELHALLSERLVFPQRRPNTRLAVSYGNLDQSVRSPSEEGSCETGGQGAGHNL